MATTVRSRLYVYSYTQLWDFPTASEVEGLVHPLGGAVDVGLVALLVLVLTLVPGP